MASPTRTVLPDDVRDRIARLEIQAASLVEGLISGMHKSPFHGFSVEFAQHREYTWGDELKHVDWKVFGRTDRFYIKQYEEETNLQAMCLVDQSESMLYQGERAQTSKYEYAATLAAALAFVLVRQQDSVGLTLFDEEVQARIQPTAHPRQLRTMAHAMSNVELHGESAKPGVLPRLAEELRRRGLVFLISDLFVPIEDFVTALRHLRHRRHEVVVLHVLDPDELDFPFQDNTRFEGLEGVVPHLLSDPRSLRDAYLNEVREFLEQVEGACTDARTDYVRINTGVAPAVSISQYLRMRLKRRGGR